METGFLNSHDGDRLSVMSHLCDQSMLEESDSLLDMMQDELNFASLSNSHFIGTHGFWDHESSSNGTDSVLPLAFSEDGPQPDSVIKEDFQKMLSEWQEQLGTLQSSDTEEIDVKDLVEMDISMSKNASEEMPSDIFEDSCDIKTVLSVEKMHLPSKDKIFNGLSLNLSENLNSFNLENFLEDDDEEEHKFGLLVAEEEHTSTSLGLSQQKVTNSNANIRVPSSTEPAVNNSIAKESEEEAVDVETVSDQIPVLEAGDLKSLLEQFEASEAFNCIVGNSKDSSDVHLSNTPEEIPAPKSQTQSLMKKRLMTTTVSSASSNVVTSSTITTTYSTSISSISGDTNGTTLHETIRDSLPREVIDRIKASNRRKAIPVIPAMPSRRPGRGATRMQVAAATLSRNKLLKLVSGGGKGGESIQLDHDYCSSTASPAAEVAPPKSFYHSNASEYVSERSESTSNASKDSEESTCAKPVLGENKVYSRLPEYYVVLAPQKALDKSKKGGSIKEEIWDKNSRKDSGLESGEVSDASEETVTAPVMTVSRDVICSNIVKSEDRKCVKNIVPSCNDNGVVTFDVQKKTEFSDRNKQTSVLRGEGGHSILKDWSTVRQDNSLSKPVAMVSVLKKNNVGCATSTPVRQQSLLISSNNSNRNCIASSSNSISTNTNSSSSSVLTQGVIETEKVQSEGPKKKKLNLEEYRSRLKELDRSRIKDESTSSHSLSLPNSYVIKPEENQTKAKDDEKDGKQLEVLSCSTVSVPDSEKSPGPQMLSVEVQTQTTLFDEGAENTNETSKDIRCRKKQRKYCSKRASSSSSSHSTSSSGSRHRKSRSQMRRRTSRRRSHGICSVSSSGSQHPRSRSNSSRSTSSYSSYSSRSRSQSRSRSRSSARRSPNSSSRPRSAFQPRYAYRRPLLYNTGWRSRSRSPSYGPRKNDWMLTEREKQRQVEERRVIYVGRIDEGTSKAELRRRFEPFGPIIDISVHFREHGDNYGFVTFAYKVDAYEAVEHGNDDPNLPRFDLCFGGRRAFCKTRYADLDGIATSDGPSSTGYSRSGYSRRTDMQAEDFDLLLREAQAKLRKRKV